MSDDLSQLMCDANAGDMQVARRSSRPQLSVRVFLGMWTVMMAAMMLPSLVPMLMRYRRAVGRRATRASTR